MRRFSSTVMGAKMRRASGTDAMPEATLREVGQVVMSLPSSSTLPASGRTSPRMVFMVVDLPDALPPSSETIRPSGTVRFTPFRALACP